MLRADLLCSPDALVGLRGRHADVDDRDVGLVAPHLEQELVGVARLADDLDARLLEQPRQPLPQERRVVRDHGAKGMVVLADVAERRKLRRQVVGDELEDAFRVAQAHELELAELASDLLQAPGRLGGDELLAAVGGLADPRSAVDVDADVAAACVLGLTAVQPDPHAHAFVRGPRSRRNGALDLDCCRRGGLGAFEDAEELVAAAVHLAASGRGDSLALQLACVFEHVRVAGAEPRQQPGRILDVAEEEGETHRTGISATTRVPVPATLSISSRPASVSTRSRRPQSPDPRSGSAPPAPSSATSTRADPFIRVTRTVAASAPACLTTFASASETT